MQRSRWSIVFMCFLAVAINYIDRANLGVAVPLIRKEFGIDPATMGLILSGFFWTYALMQLPGGWLIDRFGARATYTAATLIMSVATTATGFVGGVASMIACRLPPAARGRRGVLLPGERQGDGAVVPPQRAWPGHRAGVRAPIPHQATLYVVGLLGSSRCGRVESPSPEPG